MEQLSYQNINKTMFFSNLKIIPHTPKRMEIFIKSHCAHKIIDLITWNNVCKNTSMTKLQLDAMFIIIRYLYQSYNNIIKQIIKIAQNNMDIFQNTPNDFSKLSSNNEFFREIINDIMHNMDNKKTFENFFFDFLTTMNLLFKYSSYLKQYTNDDKNRNFEQQVFKYFDDNIQSLNKYVKIIYEAIMEKISRSNVIGSKILGICVKTMITDKEKDCLTTLISYIDTLKGDINDYALNYYSEMILNELPDSNKSSFVPITSWYNNNTETLIKAQNTKLSKLGFQIVYLKNVRSHSIIDCLIEHGFSIDNNDIIINIVQVLINEKNTIGYSNKYDTMTLYDHYTLITIANDIKQSYNYFLQQILETSQIPFDFPIEFLTRILSRLYDINIIIYLENLTCIEIDNSLKQNSNQLTIYQFHIDYFYNIIPINTTFSPIYPNKITDHNTSKLTQSITDMISYRKTENDINDIVDV